MLFEGVTGLLAGSVIVGLFGGISFGVPPVALVVGFAGVCPTVGLGGVAGLLGGVAGFEELHPSKRSIANATITVRLMGVPFYRLPLPV